MGGVCSRGDEDDDIIIEGESDGENELEIKFLCVSDKNRESSTGEVDPEGKSLMASTVQTGLMVHRRGKWKIVWNDICEATASSINKKDDELLSITTNLSDIVQHDGHYLTFDDCTGNVYQLTYDDGESSLSPLNIKGLKKSNIKWAFKRKEKVYYGTSLNLINKESDISSLRMATKTVKHNNILKFNKTLYKTLGIAKNGYMSIESALYRTVTEELLLIPHQFSMEPFSEERKNMDGTKKLIFVKWKIQETSKDLNKKREKDIRVVELNCTWDRNKGITAIDWIDEDQGVIAAISTTNIENCTESHLLVFNTEGKIIMEPEAFPEEINYQGLCVN